MFLWHNRQIINSIYMRSNHNGEFSPFLAGFDLEYTFGLRNPIAVR